MAAPDLSQYGSCSTVLTPDCISVQDSQSRQASEPDMVPPRPNQFERPIARVPPRNSVASPGSLPPRPSVTSPGGPPGGQRVTPAIGQQAEMSRGAKMTWTEYGHIVSYLEEDEFNFISIHGAGGKTRPGVRYQSKAQGFTKMAAVLGTIVGFRKFQGPNPGSNLQKRYDRYIDMYKKAVDFRDHTGSGLTEEQTECGETLAGILEKKCPHFNRMDALFGAKHNIQIPAEGSHGLGGSAAGFQIFQVTEDTGAEDQGPPTHQAPTDRSPPPQSAPAYFEEFQQPEGTLESSRDPDWMTEDDLEANYDDDLREENSCTFRPDSPTCQEQEAPNCTLDEEQPSVARPPPVAPPPPPPNAGSPHVGSQPPSAADKAAAKAAASKAAAQKAAAVKANAQAEKSAAQRDKSENASATSRASLASMYMDKSKEKLQYRMDLIASKEKWKKAELLELRSIKEAELSSHEKIKIMELEGAEKSKIRERKHKLRCDLELERLSNKRARESYERQCHVTQMTHTNSLMLALIASNRSEGEVARMMALIGGGSTGTGQGSMPGSPSSEPSEWIVDLGTPYDYDLAPGSPLTDGELLSMAHEFPITRPPPSSFDTEEFLKMEMLDEYLDTSNSCVREFYDDGDEHFVDDSQSPTRSLARDIDADIHEIMALFLGPLHDPNAFYL